MNQLLLFFTVIFCMTACKPEEMTPAEESWVGDWAVTAMSENGILFDELDLPKNPNYEKILITIPENDSLRIAGNTFVNGIVFPFEKTANGAVTFGLIFSTRAGEDKWGLLFEANIRKTAYYTITDNEMHFRDIDSLHLITFLRQ